LYKIPANTLFIGQHLVFVPECHSTNLELQRLMQQKGSAEGLVVITDNQTAGRGQRGNTWESEPGKNLTFSTGLRPSFLAAKNQFQLSMAVSLGLFDCLHELLPSVKIKIKWPNDMMLNGKKTCGILIENQVTGQTVDRSVVGIGLNVNQKLFTIDSATSMTLVSTHEWDLYKVFSLLLEKLEARYLQLRSGDVDSIRAQYSKNLFWKNEVQRFAVGERKFSGIVRGVDDDGKLMLEAGGQLRSFGFKEISFEKA